MAGNISWGLPGCSGYRTRDVEAAGLKLGEWMLWGEASTNKHHYTLNMFGYVGWICWMFGYTLGLVWICLDAFLHWPNGYVESKQSERGLCQAFAQQDFFAGIRLIATTQTERNWCWLCGYATLLNLLLFVLLNRSESGHVEQYSWRADHRPTVSTGKYGYYWVWLPLINH